MPPLLRGEGVAFRRGIVTPRNERGQGDLRPSFAEIISNIAPQAAPESTEAGSERHGR